MSTIKGMHCDICEHEIEDREPHLRLEDSGAYWCAQCTKILAEKLPDAIKQLETGVYEVSLSWDVG